MPKEFNPENALNEIYQNVFKDLNVQMDNVFNQSQTLVPVLTGLLRSTGKKEEDKSKGTISISYGSSECTYAIVVHENLNAYRRSGQAKFLEVPFLEMLHKLK